MTEDISIHASTRGATNIRGKLRTGLVNFNPRSREGSDLNSTTFYYHPKEDVTKEEAKEQILGFINSANPLTFLGQLETPVEKPLTTEQLATYKALRTYSPTTTVINDADAGMSVGYAKMK